jgi:hypothetical protein
MKPSVEERTVENKKVYIEMKEKGLTEFSFGLLLYINDREWHDGVANGRLCQVFSDYEDAKKRRVVFPHELGVDDCDDFYSDEAFKITVSRLKDDYQLVIDVEDDDWSELIFVLYSPKSLNFLMPFPDSKASNPAVKKVTE